MPDTRDSPPHLDFESVLVLDPSNKDAKAEISSIVQKISEEEEVRIRHWTELVCC